MNQRDQIVILLRKRLDYPWKRADTSGIVLSALESMPELQRAQHEWARHA